LQRPQSKLEAVILKTAKANGFQAPLFESTQLNSEKQHKQGRGLASFPKHQANEHNYPHSSVRSYALQEDKLSPSTAKLSPSTSSQLTHGYSEASEAFVSQASKLISLASPKDMPVSSEALTERLCAGLKDDLNKSELKTFKLLHTVAIEVAAARRYSPHVTHVTFFCPLEIIALALELSRTTIWRHLKIMKELGLVSNSPHKTTYRSKTLNDGSLWNIKLNPSKGKSARLSYEELKTQYRNLSLDISNQRTAYALKQDLLKKEEQLNQENAKDKQNSATKQEQKQLSKYNQIYEENFGNMKMKQSYKTTEDIKGKILVLSWSLKPLLSLSPVSNDCFISDSEGVNQSNNQSSFYLESVLDIKFTSRDDRNTAVQTAASAICIALNDLKSHKFYCDLLWNLLRRYDRGEDDFLTLFEMIQRAKVDHLEGFARSAGALFVSRLKKWKVYEEIKRTPASRVGVKPGLAA